MDCDAVLGLLVQASPSPLDRLVHGHPAATLTRVLAAATPETLLGTVRLPEAGRAVLAGLWVAADGFEEAHDIAQGLPDEWGAWWHAILHRREPDPSNALYWYRRVNGPAPVLAQLGREAGVAIGPRPPFGLERLAEGIRKSGSWEPVPFVKAVEAAQAGTPGSDAARVLLELQRLEWRTCLAYCRKAATGG